MKTREVITPGEAAARLGTSVHGLVAMIKKGRYTWTGLGGNRATGAATDGD
jgi:hypothetical protein